MLPLPCELVVLAAELLAAAAVVAAPRHVHLAVVAVVRVAPDVQPLVVVAPAALRVQPAVLPHAPFAADHVSAFAVAAQRVALLRVSQRDAASAQQAAAVSELGPATSAVPATSVARLGLAVRLLL